MLYQWDPSDTQSCVLHQVYSLSSNVQGFYHLLSYSTAEKQSVRNVKSKFLELSCFHELSLDFYSVHINIILYITYLWELYNTFSA